MSTNHNLPAARIPNFEALVAQDAQERQREQKEKRARNRRETANKSKLRQQVTKEHGQEEDATSSPTASAVARIIDRRSDGRTQRSVEYSQSMGRATVGGLTLLANTQLGLVQHMGDSHLATEDRITEQEAAENKILKDLISPSKNSPAKTVPLKMNTCTLTNVANATSKTTTSPAPAASSSSSSLENNTTNGNTFRTLAVGLVRPAQDPSMVIKLVDLEKDGDFPVDETSMQSMTTTVQVGGLVVGLMKNGTVLRILEMTVKNERSSGSSRTSCMTVGQQRGSKEPFLVVPGGDGLAIRPCKKGKLEGFRGPGDDGDEERAVLLDALRDVLLVVTEAGHAYVSMYKGNGHFTKPFLVGRDGDGGVDGGGVVEFAKLAINHDGDLVVVALRKDESVSIHKVSYNLAYKARLDVVDEAKSSLVNLVLAAASLKNKGEAVNLGFAENGEAILLDAEGLLWRIASDGSTKLVQEDAEDAISFHKMAVGSTECSSSNKKDATPFFLGSAPSADIPGTEHIWPLFPGVEAEQKFLVPGKVVSLCAASMVTGTHFVFDLDPKLERKEGDETHDEGDQTCDEEATATA